MLNICCQNVYIQISFWPAMFFFVYLLTFNNANYVFSHLVCKKNICFSIICQYGVNNSLRLYFVIPNIIFNLHPNWFKLDEFSYFFDIRVLSEMLAYDIIYV